jgi:hypothetical protein
MNRYPGAEWVPWHENAPPPDGRITYWRGRCQPIAVVLHIMAGYASTAREWALGGHFGASWHFTIGRDGSVMQHLEINDAGYQAGIPAGGPHPVWTLWRGDAENVNWYTLGIEHEGFPGMPFTAEQSAASIALCRWLAAELGIPYSREHFPAHADIDPTNRPNDFNTPAFRAEHYAAMFTPLEDDAMTDDERRLILTIATVVAGRPTGQDFATVADALAVLAPLAADDDILLLGNAQLWELAATHRHDRNTGRPTRADGTPIA